MWVRSSERKGKLQVLICIFYPTGFLSIYVLLLKLKILFFKIHFENFPQTNKMSLRYPCPFPCMFWAFTCLLQSFWDNKSFQNCFRMLHLSGKPLRTVPESPDCNQRQPLDPKPASRPRPATCSCTGPHEPKSLTFTSMFCCHHLKILLKKFFYPHPRTFFNTFRERRERWREKHQCEREAFFGCPLYVTRQGSYVPGLGTEPASYLCALTGNRTHNLLVYGTTLHPTEPHQPGLKYC